MLQNTLFRVSYQKLLKPVLFRFDPEPVHEGMTAFGEFIGKFTFAKFLLRKLLVRNYKELNQDIAGIKLTGPIGLAAGFDYDARLTQILPDVGFGFQTIGTITNFPYPGNPQPRLGRLPKSRSLMVNKGFRNKGVIEICKKLKNLDFDFPIGISIGRTNNASLSQQESIEDIVTAFKIFEHFNIKNSYYELNISCPNLFGDVTFYVPLNLRELLTELKKLNIKKPVFIKMPIEKENKIILSLLEVLAQYPFVKGVIFGNLQKNRDDKSLIKAEVGMWKTGNFSGKPTWKRSNELISLCYRFYKDRFIIIGCGGVFSAEDAYTKIKLGASLVQLITGMVYEGPQLISEINLGLTKLLKKDGFTNISQAVGSKTGDY